VAVSSVHAQPPARPRWHLDEVYSRIGKKACYLWRAADEDGMVLDILVQERRNREAAERFLGRLVEGYSVGPRVVVADKLASYGPAIKAAFPRAENSHQPTRQRERARRRFPSPEQAQRFLEPFGPIREHFCPGRHRLAAGAHRTILAERFAMWREVAGVAA
jgi:putative transposase